MKARLVTVLIIDHDDMSEDSVMLNMENTRYPNDCISPKVLEIETFDIGEWDDDHPLNQRDHPDPVGWLYANGTRFPYIDNPQTNPQEKS